MCLVLSKYFKDVGWVLYKARDRNYKPIVRIRKSFRRDIERLLLWDDKTKWSEGVNEYGVGIVSSSVMVEEDESEGSKVVSKFPETKNLKPRVYYSPDGLRVRTALFEIDARKATQKMIDLEVPGNSLIADKERCFILEGAFIKDEFGDEEYVFEAKEVPQNHVVVRTNHGILLPWTGYSKDAPEQKADRNSSEIRYRKAVKVVLEAETLSEMLDGLSDLSDVNPQLNPIRVHSDRGEMRTTGQIIINPAECLLYYRPIWCETIYDLETINNGEQKTFFEIVSNRKLVSIKESEDFDEPI